MPEGREAETRPRVVTIDSFSPHPGGQDSDERPNEGDRIVARHQKWSDLSPRKQRAIVSAAVVQVSLALAAWWDLAHRPTDGVRGSKRLWAAAILVNFVGPIAYFSSGRKQLPAPLAFPSGPSKPE